MSVAPQFAGEGVLVVQFNCVMDQLLRLRVNTLLTVHSEIPTAGVWVTEVSALRAIE